ncbi:MAG: carbonic anhydrase [Alphaproteobacteria bacterium]|nr:carbonic anhydrase [Alphaproteobacteria bacterium]
MTADFPASLLDGYRARRDTLSPGDRERAHTLARDGQRPGTMVIACCDSRVAPETVFNCAPGEIFVLRTVANLVAPYRHDAGSCATSSALEFGVEALRVRHIVVMGHALCGGIRAHADRSRTPLSPDDFIGSWTASLADLADTGAAADGDLTALEQAAVRRSVDNLATFPFVARRLEDATLALHGTWFDVATGTVWTMDPGSGRFSPFR